VVNVSNTAPQSFGKYQILERIATGGMAEIYKARLEGIGGFQRTFAIKRILPNLSQNSEYIAMLVDEAKVAGLLSHANIVQILDLGQVDSIWYIAMEYVHGRDLGAVLRRAKKKGLNLPVPHTVFVAIELLKGLEYAHQRQVMRGGRPVALNIIHRDVSPPNVLLSFQGEVKLTDFGIARASLKAMETVSGIVKGRFDYMSPEQAAGAKDLDQRSDLFSVGVVLYEMLTGHHPFRTDNEIGTIERVRSGRYTPVSQRNPEVPFTLETIVDRALQVNRDDRYPSATAFKEALDKFFHDAGFIFTHATLASYVKGLFPEATAKPAPKPGPTPPAGPTTGKVPRPSGTPVPMDTTDGPTRRLDRKRLGELRPEDQQTQDPPSRERTSGREAPLTPTTGPTRSEPSQPITPPPPRAQASAPPTPVSPQKAARPFLPPPTPVTPTAGGNSPVSGPVALPPPMALDVSGSQAKPLSDFLGGDDQETLIRKVPSGFEEEVATQLRTLAGSKASQVEPAPGKRLTATEPDSEVEASASGQRKGAKPRRALASGGGGAGLVPWAVSAFTLLLGLFVGAVISALVVLLVSGPGKATPTGPVAGPTLIEVVAPNGTEILLDGDAVGARTSVTPNDAHKLSVKLQNQAPWTTDLKLQPGETRVFIVTAAEARPAAQPAKTGKR
jgi:serine/threonine protein kinase